MRTQSAASALHFAAASVHFGTQAKERPPLERGPFLIQRATPLPLLTAIPIVHFLCRLIFRIAVPLLQAAFELILLAVDDIEIVIRELAPLLLDLALDLLPVTFDTIPIHGAPPRVRVRINREDFGRFRGAAFALRLVQSAGAQEH